MVRYLFYIIGDLTYQSPLVVRFSPLIQLAFSQGPYFLIHCIAVNITFLLAVLEICPENGFL